MTIALPPGLADVLERPWLLVGIGNDMRGDDAFGPLLARGLITAGLPAIDAGMAPENVTGPIKRSGAEVLILADATDLGEAVGTLRLLRTEDLLAGGTSTHDPSLRMLLAFLTAERPFDVHVLVAQAGTRAFGTPPSAPICTAVEQLTAAFSAIAAPRSPTP